MFKQSFIALDLETTHLSPDKGRIMEAAAVRAELFFDEQKNKVSVSFGESFDSLINPEMEVPRLALELTGLSQEELDHAPSWREVKDGLEEFLGADSAVVGHNIGFDLEFLQHQGLAVKNPVLDTLEMSQTLVPLVLSHSLDFLAETFGVQIGVSHRALEDSKTSVLVLAEILNEYLLLPPELRAQIDRLAQNADPGFAELLSQLSDRTLIGRSAQRPSRPALEKSEVPIDWEDKSLYHLPISFDQFQEWVARLSDQSKSRVVAVSHDVYLAPVSGQQRIVSPHHALCTRRFARFLEQDLGPAASLIFIKILILQHYTDTLDLSLVRWQAHEREILYRLKADPEVCPRHECEYYNSLDGFVRGKTYFSDIRGLFALMFDWRVEFKDFDLLLFSLSAAEQALVEEASELWNLRKLRGLLQQIYPLEEGVPSQRSEPGAEVERLASELDLFFGILHLVYLKREGGFTENLLIDKEESGMDRFVKLIGPADKLISKLESFTEHLQNQREAASGDEAYELAALQARLQEFAGFLREFFHGREEEAVYLLKFNDRWVDFLKSVREIKTKWQELTARFARVLIADLTLPELSLEYFQRRLGIENWQKKHVDLPGAEEFEVQVTSEQLDAENTLRMAREEPENSAVVVLPNLNQLEKFFEVFTADKKLGMDVVAYKYSGSLSAIKARMTEDTKRLKPFVLLLTKHAAIRSFTRFPYAERLFIQKLPFDPPNVRPLHKIFEVQSEFRENILPRTLYLLHVLLARFGAGKKPGGSKEKPRKRQIVLGDPRVLANYDKEFLQYLENLPDVDLVQTQN